MLRGFRSLIVSFLMFWHDRSGKEVAGAAGMTAPALSKALRGDMDETTFERLLAAVPARPHQVPVVAGCLDELQALAQAGDVPEEELVEIAQAARGSARLTREALVEDARLSRPLLARDYPQPAELLPLRRRAGTLLERLKAWPEVARFAVVGECGQYQSWALCELCCEESVNQAARDLESAASWARIARFIAERVRGPAEWRRRVLGYAMAHEANVLRVADELEAADGLFAEAKTLWQAGSDPDGLLDPGRLLEIEASLRREQCRFTEALDLLAAEVTVGRSPQRALLQRGITLEAMGDYEGAVAALLETAPRVDRWAAPRLWNVLHLNLANVLCLTGRYEEAAALLEPARDLATELGNEIDLSRLTWLEGRIAAGLGRPAEAHAALEEARGQFAKHRMAYDIALTLLEESALFLEEGRTAEVKAFAPELAKLFKSKRVHREALAALRLFHKAVQHEEATAELARSVLRYLFRARYNQDLPFSAS